MQCAYRINAHAPAVDVRGYILRLFRDDLGRREIRSADMGAWPWPCAPMPNHALRSPTMPCHALPGPTMPCHAQPCPAKGARQASAGLPAQPNHALPCALKGLGRARPAARPSPTMPCHACNHYGFSLISHTHRTQQSKFLSRNRARPLTHHLAR